MVEGGEAWEEPWLSQFSEHRRLPHGASLNCTALCHHHSYNPREKRAQRGSVTCLRSQSLAVTKQGLEAGLLPPACTHTPEAGEGQGPGPCPSPRLPLLFQTWRASTFRTVFWPSPPQASPPMAGPHPRRPPSRLLPHSPPALNSSIGSGCRGARGLRVGPACRAPSPQ